MQQRFYLRKLRRLEKAKRRGKRMLEQITDPLEAEVHLTSLVEKVRKNKFCSKPRYFKVGDVLKWTPAYISIERVRERGLAIVVAAEGPKIKVYWTGNGEISNHDVRMPQLFQLQDLAPMPEVAHLLKTIQKEFI